MTNSADPDQLASEATDLDLHCLLRQGMTCSARKRLKVSLSSNVHTIPELTYHTFAVCIFCYIHIEKCHFQAIHC